MPVYPIPIDQLKHIEIETPMWNPPNSDYILLDQWMTCVHEFKAHGYKQARIVQHEFEEELGDLCTLYIKVGI